MVVNHVVLIAIIVKLDIGLPILSLPTLVVMKYLQPLYPSSLPMPHDLDFDIQVETYVRRVHIDLALKSMR